MNNYLALSNKLRAWDFDRYGRLKSSSVLELFMDAAIAQARSMGLGKKELEDKNVFWVIVRLQYEVVKQPEPFQEVIVDTWPYDPTRFLFQRDYSLRDTSGNILVKASSTWMLMDLDTRHSVNILENCNLRGDYREERMFSRRPRKVNDFCLDNIEPCRIKAAWSDLDQNGHVNNTRYAEYIFNALETREEDEVKTFTIDFKREIRLGDEVDVYATINEDRSEALIKGVNMHGQDAFAAKIEFAK